MRIGIVAAGFITSRDDRHRRHRENVGEVVVGTSKPDPERVLVDDFEPRNPGIVIETRASRLGLLRELVQA